MGEPLPRIFLRPLGSPLPLVLFSFGVGMLLLAGQTSGWIPLHETKQVGILIATFVFPLEGVAAIMAFLARDTLAATVLGLFTTSWLSNGLLLIIGTPGATSLALGFFLLAFAAPIISLGAVALSGKPLIALILALSAIRSILDGLFQVTGTLGLEHAAGIVATVIAGFAWYAGTAFVLEDIRQQPLLPVLRLNGGESRVEDEVGVRSQL